MKTLKAGTKKYLLLDQSRVDRNAERSKKGEPVVLVAEVIDDVITLHRAETIDIKQAVYLEYSQTKPLDFGKGITAHAVYVTTGEVVLDAPAKAASKASASGKTSEPAPKTETPE